MLGNTRLVTIDLGDDPETTECSVSLPTRNKASFSSRTRKKSNHDLEVASCPSKPTELASAPVDQRDVCAFLGTSRIHFDLSMCNIVLSLMAFIFMLAVGYKWNAFLIAVIIITAVLIHILVIWWLNDGGFFFSAGDAEDVEPDQHDIKSVKLGLPVDRRDSMSLPKTQTVE